MTHLGDVVFRRVCTHKAHIRARRGYAATREDAMAPFAKSWRRECKAWTGRKSNLGAHVVEPLPLNEPAHVDFEADERQSLFTIRPSTVGQRRDSEHFRFAPRTCGPHCGRLEAPG